MRALDPSAQGPDQPPIRFWENTLELPATRLMQEARSPEFMNEWVGRRSTQQVMMLRHLLDLPVDTRARERKGDLKDHGDELNRFVLAARFALYKSMHATVDVAVGCLDQEIVALAQKADGRYDTTALNFAILDRSWPDLEKVFHLDKLHKVGFARMRLPKPPRRPSRRFKDFLASAEPLAVLRRFGADQGDGHKSELQQVMVVSRRWWKLARRGSGTAWWWGSGGEVKVAG